MSLAEDPTTPLGRRDPPPPMNFDHVTTGEEGYFDGLNDRITPPSPASIRSAFSVRMPSAPTAAEVAFAALQYLPMPTLVLSSLKTVVLANEAMGKLLGIDVRQECEREPSGAIPSVTDVVFGQSLAQLGIDMLHRGSPVWVKWEVRQGRVHELATAR